MVALHDAGFNQVQISKQLNISRCCLQSVINKYIRLGTYDNSERSRRPKNLMHGIFGLVKGDECLSATKIASDLNASLLKLVMTGTVRTYLKELAFECVVKVKK